MSGYRGVESWLPGHDPDAALLLAAHRSGWHAAGGGTKDGATDASAGGLEVGEPLPVEQWVPPGRQPFDLNAEQVHVVTLLSATAFNVLRQTGSLAVTPEVVPAAGDLDGLAAAYDWMRWQMALHVDGYTGGFPIWVWARIRRSDLISNLRPRDNDCAGSVALTLSIPRERLLMTDYLAWHDVLNGSPGLPEHCPVCAGRFCDDEGCLDTWYDDCSDAWGDRIPRDDQDVRLDWWDWPTNLRSELLDTWGTVRQIRPRWPVQGCVERIDADWVSAVRRTR